MRVTLVSTNDRMGGAARASFRIWEALRRADADAVLLCLRHSLNVPGIECAADWLGTNATLAFEEAWENLRALWVRQKGKQEGGLATEQCVSMVTPPGPGADISCLDAVRWADVINLHCTTWFLAPQDIAALGVLGKPLVWTLHDESAFTGGCHYAAECDGFTRDCAHCPQVVPAARSVVARAFADRRAALVDLPLTVVTPSRWLAERARASAILGHKRIEVLPSGLDTDIFRPRTTRLAAKRALGFSPRDRIVLMPATTLSDVRKGAAIADEFLACLAGLAARAADTWGSRLKVVFFGATVLDLSQLPVRAGSLGEIHEEAALARVYAGGDCMVTLSGYDNLPNTVHEAMSCGTPVVSFDVGGVGDMIEHGVQGLLARPGDVGALAGLTAQMLSDPAGAACMGEKARETAVVRYALPVAAARYLTLFDELLSAVPGSRTAAQMVLPSQTVTAAPMPTNAGARLKAQRECARRTADAIRQAFALRDAENHRDALGLVDSMLRETPSDVELSLVRGGLLVAAGDPGQAATWLADLYQTHPENRIGLSLCDALRMAGDPRAALDMVEKMALRNPLAPGLHKKRGQALLALGKPRQALRLFFREYRLHRDDHALTLAQTVLVESGKSRKVFRSAPVKIEDRIQAKCEALPSVYCLETVLGCNLSCVECAVGSGLVSRKYGVMPYNDYLRIADRIRAHCNLLMLHLWGEPLLNRDIVRMVAHASAYAMTNISTNAQLLDKTMAKALLQAGLTQAIVSIDGTTQETYAHYRRGGTLARAVAGLEHLVEARARIGSTVEITPQFIVFKHNEAQMDAFRRLCQDMGLKPTFKPPYLRQGSLLENGSNPGLTRPKEESPQERRRHMACDCISAREVMTILLDGTVCSCCYDHNAHRSFGNLLRQDLRDIWYSEPYRAFRRMVREGRAPERCLKLCLNH